MKDDMQQKIFTKNLNRLIEQRDLTQTEIADAIGVSQQTFNTWCRGLAIPRMGKIQALADYFKVKKSDLLEEKESKPVSSLEVMLARTMSELNEEGREKVLEYAKYLVFTGEYKKQDFGQMVVQEVS
jgi:transcriptional regulator with XRE-family HTH domain